MYDVRTTLATYAVRTASKSPTTYFPYEVTHNVGGRLLNVLSLSCTVLRYLVPLYVSTGSVQRMAAHLAGFTVHDTQRPG